MICACLKAVSHGETIFMGLVSAVVQRQGNPPSCQRFAVYDKACRVVDVANLCHKDGFPCHCTKSWLIIFLLQLSIPKTKPHFDIKNYFKTFWLENGVNLG